MSLDRSQFKEHLENMVQVASKISGHLSPKEVRFLSVLPFVTGDGEILEIGSFKGKSTVVLAKSAVVAGREKIHACDPLNLPCETDPGMVNNHNLAGIFKDNIEKNQVTDIVELHQQKSFDLADDWNQPLRILWIDGDHTYVGAMKDFDLFIPHLQPGGIVALHDVLHDHPGPARVFLERMLASDIFGDCGLCGSIGWAQFLGDRKPTMAQSERKINLYKKMSRLIPRILAEQNGIKTNRQLYKAYRTLVPHGEIEPYEWLTARNSWAS